MINVNHNLVHYQEINSDSAGQRLDNFLIKTLKGVPKSHIYSIIRSGEVRVNMKRAKPSLHLKENDKVRIPPVRISKEKIARVGCGLASQLQSRIIYEDDKFLVINKPSGMAVHGGSGVNVGVIEALRQLRSDLAYLELAHRLDKETSGCLVIAKKRSQLRALHDLLASRHVKKTYLALLSKPWELGPRQTVDLALNKNVLKSGERIVRVDENGKESRTSFKLIENYQQGCLVEAYPKTGRTHQIRVHSAHLGHPIIGDNKYGLDVNISCLQDVKVRLCLHASSISFKLDEREYKFSAAIDDTFEKIRSLLCNETAI